MIGILSNQSFVKKIFIEVLENDFPNWVLVLFGVCELSPAHSLSFLSRNGLVWLVSTWSQHKIFIFSVDAKLSITQFTMSIQDQDLHSPHLRKNFHPPHTETIHIHIQTFPFLALCCLYKRLQLFQSIM